ncbi:MAG: head GIN domain-containing protein [Methanobacterium sp.]
MKKYIIIVLLLLAVIAASGCTNQGTGSGKVINQTRDVASFNQIDFNGAGELIITQGDKESVTVQADDNLMNNIKTSVNNNKLTISFDNNMPVPTQPVKIYVTVKDLNSINVTGTGLVKSDNLNVNGLTLTINGAGNSTLNNINAQTLNILLSGAGTITTSGNVNEQNTQISGAGEYNAGNLTSKIATITINGGGKSTVKVSDTLNAIINGAGQISYIGSPKVTQQINGAGNVNKIG